MSVLCSTGTMPKAATDWKAEAVSRFRRLIKEALPDAVEEVKWRKPSKPGGVPVWYQDGMVCHVEAFKEDVRMTFVRGASIADPKELFDPRIGRNAMRAILIREGDAFDDEGIRALLRAAARCNASLARSTQQKTKK